MRIWGSRIAIGLLAVAVCGCGSDGGAGSTSGVSSTKKAQDLTTEDVKKFCAWANQVIPEPTDKQACTLLASAFSDDKASCEMSVDQCLDEVKMEQASDAPSDDASGQDEQDEQDEVCLDQAQLEDCSATIAELESCMRAGAAQAKKVYASVSCDLAGSQTDPEENEDDTPAECKKLVEKCPHIRADEGEDGEDGSSGDTYECDDGTTVSYGVVCDGSDDCASGEDEAGCSSDGSDGATSDDFACDDGSSIPSSFMCDGENDCTDGEDEAGCASDGTSSDPGEFACGDGVTTVPNDYVCDGSEDCPNGQDEVSCSSSSTGTGTNNGLRAARALFSAPALRSKVALRTSNELTRLFRAR